jgi:hypothetical protein
MPVQQRLRPDRESVPRAARQQPAQRRKQNAVVDFEPRLPNLPAKHRQLVAEHRISNSFTQQADKCVGDARVTDPTGREKKLHCGLLGGYCQARTLYAL